MSHCPSIIQQLRQRGYRITPQREMIIQIVVHSERHMTAEEIFVELKKKASASNIATVYRTLEMLWEEGFAWRNDLGEGRVVYAPIVHGPHVHLVCRFCNRVLDADYQLVEGLQKRLSTDYKFQADLQHLNLFGVCTDCQASLS